MKSEKKKQTIPRSVALRGGWLCAGSCIALLAMILVDPGIATKWTYIYVLIAAFFGLALFASNLVNATQKGVIYGHTKLLNLRSAAWPTYHFYGGTPKQYQEYFDPEIGADERIALVAWRHRNGNIYAVERPGRHGHVTWMLAEMDMAGDNLLDDGFVTNHGRYVNRKEALVIASAANQMIRNTGPVNELFSEDLWYTPKESRSPAYSDKLLDKADPRAALLTTLPSLEYLHDPSIQITQEELDAIAQEKKTPVAQAEQEAVAQLFVEAAQEQAEAAPEEVAQEEPIPESGILNDDQIRRLYAQCLNAFFVEIEAEIAEPKNVLTDDLICLAKWYKNDILECAEVDIETIHSNLRQLVQTTHELRRAVANRLVNTSYQVQLHNSNEVRKQVNTILGRHSVAHLDVVMNMAYALINYAVDEGVVITIDLAHSDHAMGQYYMIPNARESRRIYGPRMAIEAAMKENASG